MKRIFLLILTVHCSLCTIHCDAQYWMQKAGGGTIDEGIDVSADASGNSYVTGYFTTTAHFGAINLTSSGVEDIYIAKLNNAGVFLWAKKAGGISSDRPTCIKADAAGNSYVTGFYNGTASFTPFNITSAGLQDIFIAKYNTVGTCLWVRSAGGNESDIGNGITVDAFGDVIVTGQFSGTATFGTHILTSLNNSVDVFTCKLDANGNFLWAKKGSGLQTDIGVDVACDALGNVFVTGQFSDTVTFDFVHNNTMNNAIFLIKYDSSGAEQWFRIIGGATLNVVNAIAIDSLGNPFIAGDFQGTLTFFEPSGNTTLTNAYPNRIFVAKYDEAGGLSWSSSSGSTGTLTVRNLAIGWNGSPYIIGNFSCRMNEYADQYGQGTFCSVGYLDIFITKWNANGAWQWSRQIGGHGNENGAGIALNSTNHVLMTGSFTQDVIFPWSTATSPTCSNNYCSDNEYRYYKIDNTFGNSDIVIANGIDTARQPYDFFYRNGAGCTREAKGVCINLENHLCPDTIFSCSSSIIYADPQISTDDVTCGVTYPLTYPISIGPVISYLWSTGETTDSIFVSNNGYYHVTVTSVDGCFTSTDSIYFHLLSISPTPVITDDHGINNHTANPLPIHTCQPDSVLLTGGNVGSNTYQWSGGPVGDSTIYAYYTDYYYFVLSNAYGCHESLLVHVVIDSLLRPLIPGMMCIQDTHRTDTITLCGGSQFTMYCFDTLTNPGAILECIPYTTIHWHVTPSTITYNPISGCQPYTWNQGFTPQQPGWYSITATWVRINNCDTDTVIINRSLYVNLLPNPPVNTVISGDTLICPGDSIVLVASGADNYVWHGGNTNFSHNDSVWVNAADNYWVASQITYANGCTNVGIAYFTTEITPQPSVTMTPASGVICPNDSVRLVCTGSGTFAWQGPGGPVGGDTSTIYVSQSGTYYCIFTDPYNCTLVSNSVDVTEYNTPYLIANPDTVICQGDSATITIVTNPNTIIHWNSPLSGSSLTQIVHTAGTYSCNVTACNIISTPSITIGISNPVASFHADTLIGCIPFVVHFINTSTNANSYHWNFGDNTTDTSANPAHTYTTTGTFTITLTCYLNGHCKDSMVRTNYIIVSNNPITSSFSATPLSGCNPLTVTFNNTSTNATSFLWNFGDSNTSNLTNPTHTYTNSGTYTVTLIVYNNALCGGISDTVIRINYITVYPNAVAAFISDTLIGCPPFSVNFINSSTNAFSYHWNFGDLDTSTATNPSHTYSISGNYTVTLIAYNTNGCNDTTIQSNYISVITPPLPTSSFNASPLSGCDSIFVHFNNTSTNGTSYTWRFGDGTTDTSINPIHFYDSIGTFTVKLITFHTSICGTLADSSIQTNYITINRSAHASFHADTLTGCIPFTVNFTNGSTFATAYHWAFGDGNTSSSSNPNTTYITAGVYTVTLIADGAGGCNDTAYLSFISVLNPPHPTSSFIADTLHGCTPLTVKFTNTGTDGVHYFWNFDDSSTSTIKNPIHTFTDSGLYTIKLITINDTSICGRFADSTIQTDYIAVANPVIITSNFSGYPIKGCTPLIIDITNNSTNATNYYWNFGNGQSSTDKDPSQLSYINSGTYMITLITYHPNARCYNPPDTMKLQIIAESCVLSIPNTFSPNGDGKNDFFNLIAGDFANYHLLIFNRWGQKIFESNDKDRLWNGTINNIGSEAPDGTYYYIFTAIDMNGIPVSDKGFITLIR